MAQVGSAKKNDPGLAAECTAQSRAILPEARAFAGVQPLGKTRVLTESAGQCRNPPSSCCNPVWAGPSGPADHPVRFATGLCCRILRVSRAHRDDSSVN